MSEEEEDGEDVVQWAAKQGGDAKYQKDQMDFLATILKT